jgi:dynein heavy chain
VDPRFIARFNVFNLSAPTAEVLKRIYCSIVTAHFKDFDPSIATLATGKMTDVLLKVYRNVVEKMPPTPAKFHYIFNLRDLGRVWQGMCLATPDKFTTVTHTLRLFRNELTRIFSDRLIKPEDKTVIEQDLQKVFRDEFPSSGGEANLEDVFADPLLFGDFESCVERIVEQKEDPRLYGDVGDFRSIRVIFDHVLESYNMEQKPMLLVLFEAALDHLSRIHRIIRMPRGHALLVGVGGSGKQSLSKLAAYTASMGVFEIVLCRGYGETEFRDDLKTLFARLGKGQVMFLFTDAHVVQEGFLEFVNNILTTGTVPALFENDEKEALISGVRQEVKAAGLAPTSDNCWKFYVDRCRNNLHLVLSMSPSGETLRVRCRNFPGNVTMCVSTFSVVFQSLSFILFFLYRLLFGCVSLVSNTCVFFFFFFFFLELINTNAKGLVSATVIDWFFPWPADALMRVGEFFLEEESIPEEDRANVVEHMVHVHTTVLDTATQFREELRRYYYITPKNYLDFISNYRLQLKDNREKLSSQSKRLEGGLTKLVEAAEAVDRMQVDLKAKKVIVDQKTVICESMIKDITKKVGPEPY